MCRKTFLLICILALAIFANGQASNSLSDEQLKEKLEAIRVKDLTLRMLLPDIRKRFGKSSKQEDYVWTLIHKQDKQNEAEVLKIIDKHGWVGTDKVGTLGNQALWLVIQHSDIETQEKYLPRLRESVSKGDSAGWYLAFLEDRVLVRKGEKQIYGTQAKYDKTSGESYFYPIRDFENVNKRRKKLGLETIEEYAKKNGYLFESKRNSKTKVAEKKVSEKSIYTKDFEAFWRTVESSFAYFDKKQTDWARVKEIYTTKVAEVKTRQEFTRFLEIVLRELYDNHTQLNTNLSDSSRLVPSGTDIWAEWKNDKAIIVSLRKGFGAEENGLKVGMKIVEFNGIPIKKAIEPFIGKALKVGDAEVKNWALNNLLAGTHNKKRIIKAKLGNETKDFAIDEPKMRLSNYGYPSKLESKKLENNVGYIKINNTLGDNSLIQVFDKALDELLETKGLILDLRETPGGGNSTVGRAILSRFILKEMTFQKHSQPAEKKVFGVERSWFEIVSPRGKNYSKPLVVLVNRWTGSMGEGIAIGFDGMKRAKVVGTKMGRLAGGMWTFTLPNTKIRYSFPVEKIFHINGQPREEFIPDVFVEMDNSEGDKILRVGLEQLKKQF